MQLSRFVIAYHDVRPGEHVLYSVLHDRYAGIDTATIEAIARWTAGAPVDDEDEREAQQVLLDDGFLVRSRAEDDANLRAYLDRAADGIAGTMHVTLMPTLACNLACTYCFQKEQPAFTKMQERTEQSTLEWILRRVDERGLRALHVLYFGGEPLTRKDFMLRTAKVLSASMAARGGTFTWSCITNGIGLTPDFVRKMLPFGKGSFKVTLDGDRETHDQMRVYRNGRGSFDQIFENVVVCAPLVRIHVGGNFLPELKDSFERLLDRIDAAGLRGKLAGVHFKPVMDTQRSKSSCTGCDGKQESQVLVQLNRSIEKHGLGIKTMGGETLEAMLGPCELHWKNNYTIDPEGRVYKCPAVAGLPGLEVDTVSSHGAEKVAPLVALRPWERCGDCAYLPVCVGGCLGGKHLKTGRTDEVNCKKDSLELSFRESVVRRYLAEFPTEESSPATAA
ncbi:MAG TPA: radical SAM protein [Myxococcales bacterium]|nr:radical SAM protein [Myxococcales bacterium]